MKGIDYVYHRVHGSRREHRHHLPQPGAVGLHLHTQNINSGYWIVSSRCVAIYVCLYASRDLGQSICLSISICLYVFASSVRAPLARRNICACRCKACWRRQVAGRRLPESGGGCSNRIWHMHEIYETEVL